MKDAVFAFVVAAGVTGFIVFLLMGRAPRRGRASAARGQSDGGGFEASGDSQGHFFGWLGGEHSRTDGPVHSGGSEGFGGGETGGGDSGGGGGDGGGGD